MYRVYFHLVVPQPKKAKEPGHTNDSYEWTGEWLGVTVDMHFAVLMDTRTGRNQSLFVFLNLHCEGFFLFLFWLLLLKTLFYA